MLELLNTWQFVRVFIRGYYQSTLLVFLVLHNSFHYSSKIYTHICCTRVSAVFLRLASSVLLSIKNSLRKHIFLALPEAMVRKFMYRY